MNALEERSRRAGQALRKAARGRAEALGSTDELLAAVRRRRRIRDGLVLSVLVVLATVLVLPQTRGGPPVIDSVGSGGIVTTWSGLEIELPVGWSVADRTLTPRVSLPRELFTASTAPMPLGNDRCAQAPEAAMEQLGPTDALVTVQRGHPVMPADPTIGELQRWPEDARNNTSLRECPHNGDQLTMYWFHAQLDGIGHYVLGVFGPQADDDRRDEALAIVNSLRPASNVPDVRGLTVAQAKSRLEAAGLRSGISHASDDRAVVAVQEPGPGTRVDGLDVTVGLRTAIITPQLCVVMTDVVKRDGDALALTRQDGYWDMLEKAMPHAPTQLARAIQQTVAHRDAGRPLDQIDTETLDAITLAHDACHYRQERNGP